MYKNNNNKTSWYDSLNYLIVYYEGILSARSILHIPERMDPANTMLHSYTHRSILYLLAMGEARNNLSY